MENVIYWKVMLQRTDILSTLSTWSCWDPWAHAWIRRNHTTLWFHWGVNSFHHSKYKTDSFTVWGLFICVIITLSHQWHEHGFVGVSGFNLDLSANTSEVARSRPAQFHGSESVTEERKCLPCEVIHTWTLHCIGLKGLKANFDSGDLWCFRWRASKRFYLWADHFVLGNGQHTSASGA